MKEESTDQTVPLPKNMQEFNQIVSIVLGRLYPAFPLEKTLEGADVAAAMGVDPGGLLPSGRPFAEVFDAAMKWLLTERFTHSGGSHARERATLASRSLSVMNAVPPVLQDGPRGLPSAPASSVAGSTGTMVVEATNQAASGVRKELAEIAGSFVGSLIKSGFGS